MKCGTSGPASCAKVRGCSGTCSRGRESNGEGCHRRWSKGGKTGEGCGRRGLPAWTGGNSGGQDAWEGTPFIGEHGGNTGGRAACTWVRQGRVRANVHVGAQRRWA
jgi:hypothetical protein